jgi:hypothetical protein
MARPPEGPGLADRLEGPEEAKQRLKVILETISGERTIADAAAAIGVGLARFHELRNQVLQAALAALEPKPAGRPRSEAPADADPKLAELEAQVRELTLEIKASNVREQIALTMPHLLKRIPGESSPEATEPQKKTRTKPSQVLDKIRKDRKRRP